MNIEFLMYTKWCGKDSHLFFHTETSPLGVYGTIKETHSEPHHKNVPVAQCAWGPHALGREQL